MPSKKEVKKTAEHEEVIIGGNEPRTPRANEASGEVKMPWERDFGNLPSNDIIELPSIANMAGMLANSKLTTEEERIAYLRIIRRLEKFGLKSRIEFIRQCLASTLGMKGFAVTTKLQDRTKLVTPAVIREQIGMKQIKGDEQTVKNSDFRERTDDREPRDHND